MAANINSKDVAKLAGVSQATVSRAISNPDMVSAETRERVLRAMRVLNYVPHRGAQILKRGKSEMIGLVVSDLLNPAIPYMLNEMTSALDSEGYRTTVWHDATSPDDLIRGIQERAVDGLIFTTAMSGSKALQTAIGMGTPVLLLNRTVEGAPCDQVSSDNREGAAAVADYLVSNGRTNIAYIRGNPEASTTVQREAGFLLRAAELGFPVQADRIRNGEFSYEKARVETRSLLESDSPPDAIFCTNDLMAFGALNAIHEHRAHTDINCWVVGFDDIPMASWSTFDLTTVRQPFPEMIREGVEVLLRRIEDRSVPPRKIEFRTELVVRSSTDHAPIH